VTEQPETTDGQPAPGAGDAQVPAADSPQPASWAPPDAPANDFGAAVAGDERPEIPVGAAFAGGFVLALILKRIAG
jgi:hypothetical protein